MCGWSFGGFYYRKLYAFHEDIVLDIFDVIDVCLRRMKTFCPCQFSPFKTALSN